MDLNDESDNTQETLDGSKEYEKILDSINELANLSEDTYFSKDAKNFPEHDNEKFIKFTEAKREIFVELNMYVLQKNDMDEAAMPEIHQHYSNHYRIPMPDEIKEEEYMMGFLEHFEKAMKQSIIR